MMLQRTDAVKVAAATISVLLQLILAPNMALFGSFPCFPLVCVLVLSVACPSSSGPVLPFVVGLVCDLMGSGPVGAMALLFLLASMIVSRVFLVMNNDSLFMPLLILFFGLLAVEGFYGFILGGFDYPVAPMMAFVGRAVPCALYDFVIALLLYPIMMRMLEESTVVSKNNMPHIKLR